MVKRQVEKLTPATSQATYPTIVELRREGGFLFKSVAAAVLATGLSGCGKGAETSTADAGASETRSDRIMEVSGTADLGAPDHGWPLSAYDDASIDSLGKDATDTRDAPAPFEPDAGARGDAPDGARPDLGTPDRQFVWVDGGPSVPDGPIDRGVQYATDARDAYADSQAPDGSTDSERDVK